MEKEKEHKTADQIREEINKELIENGLQPGKLVTRTGSFVLIIKNKKEKS